MAYGVRMDGQTMMCDRCGAGPAGADLFDHCALCGQALCDLCMAAGCCGQTPAISGRVFDKDPDERSSDEPAGE